AIALATAAFLAAQSTTDSVTASIDSAYDIYGSDAWVWFQEPVGNGFAATLRSIPEVQQVEAWSNSSAEVADLKVTMWGIPPDTGLYRYATRVTDGRWFRSDESDSAVISTRFAETRGLHPGARFAWPAGGRAT